MLTAIINLGELRTLHDDQEKILAIAVVIFATGVLWQFGIDWQPITPDSSMQIYAAQEILRGRPPYVAIVMPHTPLTSLTSALAIALGGALGISDVLSIRLFFLFLGIWGALLAWRLAKVISPHPIARIVSVLGLLGFQLWGVYVARGPEVKILVIVCGLLALLALQERRWLLAGLASVLAFLTWQPAAIYLLLSLAAAFWRGRNGQGSALPRVLVGIFLPTSLILGYLVLEGALWPALRQAILHPFRHGLELAANLDPAILQQGASHLFSVAMRAGSHEWWLILVGSGGWIGFTMQALASWHRSFYHSQGKDPWPVLISGYWWFFFSMRNLQGRPDLIPLLPYTAWGAGWVVHHILSFLKGREAQHPPVSLLSASSLAAAGAVFAVLAYGFWDLPLQKPEVTLPVQVAQARQLDKVLGPQGQVQAIGDLTLLVLSERINLTPLTGLEWRGYQLQLQEPGGVDGILQTIAQTKPQVLILHSQDWNYPWSQPFLKFAEEHYLAYLDMTVLRLASLRAPPIPESGLPATAHPYFVNFANQIQLQGYTLRTSRIRAGRGINITIYLKANNKIDQSYILGLYLMDTGGKTYGQRFVHPWSDRNYGATPLWAPGQLISLTYRVPVAENFPAPASARIALAFFSYPNWEPEEILETDGEIQDNRAILTSIDVQVGQ